MIKISFLTDNPKSWIIPYVEKLKGELAGKYEVKHCYSFNEIEKGDIAFFLGCNRLVPGDVLRRNRHNIVVHPSALPLGKGFSPLAWQVLEGKNEIPVTLFDAVEEVDAGPIYYQDVIRLEGHELNDEIKALQGEVTVRLVLRFLSDYPEITGRKQEGESTYYRKFTEKDNELDVNRSIAEQFNILRKVDNEQYPAYFWHRGHKFIIKIYKTGGDS